MSQLELQHAAQYAIEKTKLFLFQKYAKRYPQFFQHADIQTRPATDLDFYVPPTLQGVVVESTRFRQVGCERLSCFPFREDGSPCQEGDGVRWIPVGTGFTMGCQQSCFEKSTVNTEWLNDTCVLVNPHKKLLAIFPEQLSGMKSKHSLHGGLDWKDGDLHLNALYCHSYGLSFENGDCVESLGQTILEFLFGKTTYRAIKTASVQKPNIPVPSVPPHMVYKKRTIRSLPIKEMAVDLSVDVGLDVSLQVVQNILKKKAPQLLSRAAGSIAVRTALQQAVVQQLTVASTQALVTAGKMVGAASTAFAGYGIAMMILDVLDPFHFENVLTAEKLKEVSRDLDNMYFLKSFKPVVTPEFVWDFVLNEEDESDRYDFMADRIEEYLQALQTAPAAISQPPQMLYKYQSVVEKWSWSIHVAVVLMLCVMAILWLQNIHYWGLVMLGVMLYCNQ